MHDIVELLSRAEAVTKSAKNQVNEQESLTTPQAYDALKKTASFLQQNPFPSDQEIEDFVANVIELDRSRWEKILLDLLSFFLKGGLESLMSYLDAKQNNQDQTTQDTSANPPNGNATNNQPNGNAPSPANTSNQPPNGVSA